MRALFERNFDLLSNMLNFRAERHKVILGNIANIETVDYKARELDFQENLEAIRAKAGLVEMRKTDAKHLAAGEQRGQFALTRTQEKVELDRQMADLAENNFMYNFTVELLARKFRGLATALREIR